MTSRDDLVTLGRTLGERDRDLVLLAEGNISARLEGSLMLVKASGCSMGSLVDDDILTVDRSVILTLADRDAVTDADVARAYRDSVVSSEPTPRMPSVEAILHAVLYADTDAQVIAHTHPTAINAILCSQRPELLVNGSLFPDQVVVLGRRQVLVPYTDPGVPLARAVHAAVSTFIAEQATTPRVIYLVNHGLFVLAASTAEAVQVTDMAVKTARILLGTLAAGGPRYLSDENVDRIDGRPDEHYRRAVLSGDQGGQ
jgi:rhamnose utilization protein RhaD (predicted bifunctional aldolase and dehydrogenase)